MIALLFDRPIPGGHDADLTLLELPVGAFTPAQMIRRQLPIGADDEVLVIPPEKSEPKYTSLGAGVPLRVIQSSDQLAQAIDRLDPTDRLCLIDAGTLTSRPAPLRRIARRHCEFPGVIAVVGNRAEVEGIHERVVSNSEGNVLAIQRVYPQVLGTAVDAIEPLALIVPARFCTGLPMTSLKEVAESLRRVGHLSEDVYIDLSVYQLTTRSALLAFHECCTFGPPPGFQIRRSDLDNCWLLAPSCTVADSVQMTGCVVVHERAVIEEGARLVGPVTVGAGCRIGRFAVVANSVLAPGTTIAPHRVVSHDLTCQTRITDPAPKRTGESVHRHRGQEIWNLGPIKMPSDQTERTNTEFYALGKRAMDVLLSGLGLIVLSPLLLLIALLLKLDSRGPLFFAHRREGRNGREFNCLKFRTMTVGAHRRQRDLAEANQVDGPQFKIEEDPRVTRLGKILRAANLDELPQLLNVFVGDMSLVGPRPSPFRENQICIPWRRARLSVRPGITGLWQLCKDRDRGSDFQQWIMYDLAYVRHQSFLVDLKLLIATVLSLGGQCSVPMHWIIPRSQAPRTYETGLQAA